MKADVKDLHSDAAGALCTEDDTGCCTECGVAMDTCAVCNGVGYHRAGCRESGDTTPATPPATTEYLIAITVETPRYLEYELFYAPVPELHKDGEHECWSAIAAAQRDYPGAACTFVHNHGGDGKIVTRRVS